MHLFTYGSLMFPAVWRTVVAGRYVSDVSRVSGYVRKCIRGETYPAVVPCDEQAILQGRVYFDISRRDMIRLDAFEGEYYRREVAEVMLPDGQSVGAELYVLRQRYEHLLGHEEWDPVWFEREGMRRFIAAYKGFPAG